MSTPAGPCELCDGDGGTLIFRGERLRVVKVEGADGMAYPGFCRVVWNAHVRELTDLAPADRDEFMRAVFAVEAALRQALQPHKMNVASLGNLTPHLHWHVIPRYQDDAAFPKPIWAVPLPAGAGLDTLAPLHRRKSQGGAEGDWENTVRRALEAS